MPVFIIKVVATHHVSWPKVLDFYSAWGLITECKYGFYRLSVIAKALSTTEKPKLSVDRDYPLFPQTRVALAVGRKGLRSRDCYERAFHMYRSKRLLVNIWKRSDMYDEEYTVGS